MASIPSKVIENLRAKGLSKTEKRVAAEYNRITGKFIQNLQSQNIVLTPESEAFFKTATGILEGQTSKSPGELRADLALLKDMRPIAGSGANSAEEAKAITDYYNEIIDSTSRRGSMARVMASGVGGLAGSAATLGVGAVFGPGALVATAALGTWMSKRKERKQAVKRGTLNAAAGSNILGLNEPTLPEAQAEEQEQEAKQVTKAHAASNPETFGGSTSFGDALLSGIGEISKNVIVIRDDVSALVLSNLGEDQQTELDRVELKQEQQKAGLFGKVAGTTPTAASGAGLLGLGGLIEAFMSIGKGTIDTAKTVGTGLIGGALGAGGILGAGKLMKFGGILLGPWGVAIAAAAGATYLIGTQVHGLIGDVEKLSAAEWHNVKLGLQIAAAKKQNLQSEINAVNARTDIDGQTKQDIVEGLKSEQKMAKRLAQQQLDDKKGLETASSNAFWTPVVTGQGIVQGAAAWAMVNLFGRPPIGETKRDQHIRAFVNDKTDMLKSIGGPLPQLSAKDIADLNAAGAKDYDRIMEMKRIDAANSPLGRALAEEKLMAEHAKGLGAGSPNVVNVDNSDHSNNLMSHGYPSSGPNENRWHYVDGVVSR